MITAPYGIMEDFEAIEPTLIGILIAALVFYLIILVFGIVAYVLNSAGMYTIAKRRGIHNPWLAWIPVANSWLLGSISDQYQYVVKGKVRSRRKLLLTLSIIGVCLPVFTSIIGLIIGLATLNSAGAGAAASLGVTIISWVLCFTLYIVYAVFNYIALYDLYCSCNPNNAVTFLVLGIFISVTQPFFVFSCRKKDFGMPPRKLPTEPVQEIPQQVFEGEVVETQDEAVAEEQPETTATESAVQTEEVPDVVEAEPCTADEEDFAEEPPVNE